MNKAQREWIYVKYEGHCAYCGEKVPYEKFQVDHIIPKRNFDFCVSRKWNIPFFLKHLTINDVNHEHNLFPSCRVCNKRKDTLSIEDFRAELQLQVARAQKLVQILGWQKNMD